PRGAFSRALRAGRDPLAACRSRRRQPQGRAGACADRHHRFRRRTDAAGLACRPTVATRGGAVIQADRIVADRILLGWREWLSLPALGVTAIKAKLDTGARTSALHAFRVEAFETEGRSRVRLALHPLQKRNDVIVECEADVLDYRKVTDSGGHSE